MEIEVFKRNTNKQINVVIMSITIIL